MMIRQDRSPLMRLITTNGLALPQLGLGTYRMTGAACQRAVECALALGYRHIDTAEMYANQDAIGAALAAAGLPRTALHLTSKVHHGLQTPAQIRAGCEMSLGQLRTDYVDLCLLHWPRPGTDLPAALAALMDLQRQGLTRRIGVANFPVALLREAIEVIGAPIVCNQIEYHLLIDQTVVLSYMRSHGLTVIAHVPLAQGHLADQPVLAAIARKYGATPAQVALQWLLAQADVAAIPKAERPDHQAANLAAVDLRLDEADRLAIAALPKRPRFVNPPFVPRWD
jgi:2,5-diketo-D-gluconate reductase B